MVRVFSLLEKAVSGRLAVLVGSFSLVLGAGAREGSFRLSSGEGLFLQSNGSRPPSRTHNAALSLIY
jgi:hypothetical protein